MLNILIVKFLTNKIKAVLFLPLAGVRDIRLSTKS
jgi:hypothetical protein